MNTNRSDPRYDPITEMRLFLVLSIVLTVIQIGLFILLFWSL